MKKVLLIFFVLISLIFSLFSCNTNNEGVLNIDDLKMETLSSKNIVNNKNKTKIVDSFYDDNDNWYYVIEIGSIARMPLQSMNDTGMFRWTQNATSYTKTLTSTKTDSSSMKEMVENQILSAVDSSLENKITTSTNLSVSSKFNFFDLTEEQVQATVAFANETLWKSSSSYQKNYKTSYEQVSTKTTVESISETIEFTPDCPTGYYGWNLCGNIKVYSFVIYNPLSQTVNISYIADIVSSYWSFDYLTDEEFDNLVLKTDFNEYFDYELPELNEPEKYFDVDMAIANAGKSMLTVSFDGNGGYCNKCVVVPEGGAYGILPTPTYNSDKCFVGWYDDFGNKITSDTICTYGEDHTLKAKWIDVTYSANLEDFSLGELTINKETIMNFNVDRDALIDAGLTAYKVHIEFNARGKNSISEDLYFELMVANISYGAVQFNASYSGEHKDYTFGSYTSGDTTKLFETATLSPTANSIKLRWSNANFNILYNYTAEITGLKVSITFYDPTQA